MGAFRLLKILPLLNPQQLSISNALKASKFIVESCFDILESIMTNISDRYENIGESIHAHGLALTMLVNIMSAFSKEIP